MAGVFVPDGLVDVGGGAAVLHGVAAGAFLAFFGFGAGALLGVAAVGLLLLLAGFQQGHVSSIRRDLLGCDPVWECTPRVQAFSAGLSQGACMLLIRLGRFFRELVNGLPRGWEFAGSSLGPIATKEFPSVAFVVREHRAQLEYIFGHTR